MSIQKYSDPAVQDRTQDAATDRTDDLHQKNNGAPRIKNNSSDKKRRAYKEGNKDDSNTAGPDKDMMDKHTSYGKRL